MKTGLDNTQTRHSAADRSADSKTTIWRQHSVFGPTSHRSFKT